MAQAVVGQPSHIKDLSMKTLTLALLLTLAGLVHANVPGRPDAPDLSTVTDTRSWRLFHVSAESLALDGRQVVRLVAEGDSANGIVGLALPVALDFATGMIEIDLKGKNVRQNSFLGVAFNVADEKTFEAVYFRPFNFRAEAPMHERAVQYISWPANTWEHLRKNSPGQFEKPVSPVPDPDGWFHARIEVTEKQVRVYVNDASEPSLVTPRLAGSDRRRPVGLFVDSADGLYANMKVTSSR